MSPASHTAIICAIHVRLSLWPVGFDSCWRHCRTIRVMPGFHHSVAVLPFRSYRCRCRWERKCWKRLSVYIGMKWPAVVHQRQNGKK